MSFFGLSGLIDDGVNAYIQKQIDAGLSIFQDCLAGIASSASTILDMDVVSQAILYTQAIAGTLLALKIAFDALFVYILRSNGDPGANPGSLLLNGLQSAAIIGTGPWLVKWIFQFGSTVASDIAGLPGVNYKNSGSAVKEIANFVLTAGNSILFAAVAIIFALILLAVITIQSYIRSGNLALLACIGPVAAVGMKSQLFSTWWKEILAVSFTQAAQILMIKLSFAVLQSSLLSDIPFSKILLFIGFLWATVKTPNTIKQFTHSTGFGSVAGGAAQQVGSMALMRKILTRGVA